MPDHGDELKPALKTVYAFVLAYLFLAGVPIAATADWREDMGRFRIGIVQPTQSDNALLELEPFRLAVEEKLGLTVELLTFSSQARLARAHAGARVEYAVYPATTYAATWINCECIEPLVTAAAGDGTTQAQSVLITRRSSNIRSPADLAGKSVWLLADEGILTHRYAVHAMALDTERFDESSVDWATGENPRSVIERFVQGEGDALVGWSSLVGDEEQGYSRGTPRVIAEQLGGFSQYRIVWKSPPLTHHVHAVAKKVDGEAKQLLRELLNGMNETDPVAYDSIEPVFEGGLQTVPHSSLLTAIAFVRSLLPEEASEENQPADETGQVPDENDSAADPNQSKIQ